MFFMKVLPIFKKAFKTQNSSNYSTASNQTIIKSIKSKIHNVSLKYLEVIKQLITKL